MAIFYFGDIKICTRGCGRDAVSHAAYQAKRSMTNEWNRWYQTKVTKQELVEHEVILPPEVPEEFRDAEKLWNSIEIYEGKYGRTDAQLCRYFELELQNEFTHKENMIVLDEFLHRCFVDAGMCVQKDIHRRSDGSEHAHIQLTMREWDEKKNQWKAKSEKRYLCRDKDGNEEYLSPTDYNYRKNDGVEKVFRYEKDGMVLLLTQTEAKEQYPDYKRKSKDPVSRKINLNDAWDNHENIFIWRKAWADINNKMFEKKGLDIRIDHRSYEEQGLPYLPKESYDRAEIEQMKRGEIVSKQIRNAEIDAYNEKIELLIEYTDYCIDMTENLIVELEAGEQTSESIERIQNELEYYDGTIKAILQSGLFTEKYSEYWKQCMDEFRNVIMNLIKKIRERLNLEEKHYKVHQVHGLDELIADANKSKQEAVTFIIKNRNER